MSSIDLRSINPVRVQLFIDLTIKTDIAYFIKNKWMKLFINNLIKRACHEWHALLNEQNSLLYQNFLYLGFIDVLNIDQNEGVGVN